MFNNNGVKWSIIASGVALALCVLCMLAGGLTWLTGAAGWLAFLALVFSAVVGLTVFRLINIFDRQDWLAERRSVIERMEDAQRCIAAEERAHNATKNDLRRERDELTRERGLLNTARAEYESMRTRCSQKDNEIKTLKTQLEASKKENFTQATQNANTLEEIRQQVKRDNDTWRKQVSNMREAAYNMAVFIEGSAGGLPEEWEPWTTDLAQGLRKLAAAGGVETDERQISIDDADDRKPGYTPPALAVTRTETPAQQLNRLIATVRENQAQRRADLDVITKAIESGYVLSAPFCAAYQRGMIHVTDEVIANERRYIEHSQASE